MPQQEITIYYLEMTQPTQLRPKSINNPRVALRQVTIPLPALNRFFYTEVGRTWHWTDRLVWNDEQWQAWADRPTLETWVLYLSGTPAGYFELEQQAEGNIELAYFGLLSQFVGQGLGGYLLSQACQRAWQWDARRVWLHTCTLDHPSALANYQARGFSIYKTQVKTEEETSHE